MEPANASKSNDFDTWRRERDSNPRTPFEVRRFPGEPNSPLSHPSNRRNHCVRLGILGYIFYYLKC